MFNTIKTKTMQRTVLASVIAATLAYPICANAVATVNNNFTMLDGNGDMVGGTNDVTFDYNGTPNTNTATAVVNATLVSAGPWPFFGQPWTAYQVKVYGPGSYTISTADTPGSAGCPYSKPTCASGGNYTVTVAAGRLMAHMKFAWGTQEGIDVIDVWPSGSWTTLNAGYPIWTGRGGTYTGPTYDRVSIDWDGNGIPGGAMIDGPFTGFNANFNVNIAASGTGTGTTALTSDPRTAADPSVPGCSITSTSTPLTRHVEWWLVAGFLAWLGIVQRRRTLKN